MVKAFLVNGPPILIGLASFELHGFPAYATELELWFGGVRNVGQELASRRIIKIASCLICCYQSSIPMRLCARLASSKLTLLRRSSTTSRTTDSEYLFWAEFFLHGDGGQSVNHISQEPESDGQYRSYTIAHNTRLKVLRGLRMTDAGGRPAPRDRLPREPRRSCQVMCLVIMIPAIRVLPDVESKGSCFVCNTHQRSNPTLSAITFVI